MCAHGTCWFLRNTGPELTVTGFTPGTVGLNQPLDVARQRWVKGEKSCGEWDLVLLLSLSGNAPQSALLEEQKSVMQKCSQEQRKLAAEWAEFHTQQQLRKEQMERNMDRALKMDSQREGTIMSLAKVPQ